MNTRDQLMKQLLEFLVLQHADPFRIDPFNGVAGDRILDVKDADDVLRFLDKHELCHLQRGERLFILPANKDKDYQDSHDLNLRVNLI
jgi:hypothetical protein